MKTPAGSTSLLPDPAAVLASALSLWQACQRRAAESHLSLSECYNGMDQFMREVMRVATQFEVWACSHIDFEQMADVWPYFLEDRFGETCLAVMLPSALASFDESDCLRVAMRLRLPIICDGTLPVPIMVSAPNPLAESAFREFRIQTVRDTIDGDDTLPYSSDEDPFDEEFGSPYFGFYGIGPNGLVEHIADRATYSEAVSLTRRLVLGITFPDAPPSSPSASARK
jgi:hypothetical protein